MCGRITQLTRAEQLTLRFEAPFEEISEHRDLRIRFNLGPLQDALIVLERDGQRQLTPAHWGFLPGWAKDRSLASKMINARLENVTSSKAYGPAFRKQRALIPADGFYEWQETPSGKVPHYVTRADGEPHALAGIWSTWTDPTTKQPRATFSILTTEADPFMSALHHRQPVAIPPEDWAAWLDPQVGSEHAVQLALQLPEEGEWQAWPVTKQVNSVRNDDPSLIEPTPEPS
jgi:putative SOS response-associated peptidase YedK